MKKLAALLVGAALMVGVAASVQAFSFNVETDYTNNLGNNSNPIFNSAQYSNTLNFSPSLASFNNVFFDITYSDVATTDEVWAAVASNTTGSVSSFTSIGLLPGYNDSAEHTASFNLLPLSYVMPSPIPATGLESWTLFFGFRESTDDNDKMKLHGTVLRGDYNSVTAPVPEPGTMVLLGFGMLGLAIYGKRRINKEA